MQADFEDLLLRPSEDQVFLSLICWNFIFLLNRIYSLKGFVDGVLMHIFSYSGSRSFVNGSVLHVIIGCWKVL